ncbi:MAG: hypothetical protein WAV18_16360 [Roseiarcus sp.]
MKSTRDGTAFVLPPALLAEVEAAAQEDHRAVDDVVRDFIEHGLSDRRWKTLVEKERKRARDAGLPEDDQPMAEEYRRSVRGKIAQGLQSLRDGKATDGETFMAKMDAELAELERQGR